MIIFPGRSSRFLPEMKPENAENFPPIRTLMCAVSPVNAEWSLDDNSARYTRTGVAGSVMV